MTELTAKNRWPIVLFSIPFAAVLFGILMVTVALKFPDDMVVDQYYKEGMAINQRLADTQNAKKLGIVAVIDLEDRFLATSIAGSAGSVFELNFHHVTDENRDMGFRLTRQGDVYTILEGSERLAVLSDPGVWYLELTDIEKTWRLNARLETPQKQFRMGYEQ